MNRIVVRTIVCTFVLLTAIMATALIMPMLPQCGPGNQNIKVGGMLVEGCK